MPQSTLLPYQGLWVARLADGSMPLGFRTGTLTGGKTGHRSNVFRFPGPPNDGSLRKEGVGALFGNHRKQKRLVVVRW